jgi:hypothetical protein
MSINNQPNQLAPIDMYRYPAPDGSDTPYFSYETPLKFTATTSDDLPIIANWSALDPWHQNKNIPPEWWLTGNSPLLAGRIDDVLGTVLFFRFDSESDGTQARVHLQFAARDIVNKERLVSVLSRGFPVVAREMKSRGFKSIVFESISPSLINFFGQLGFKPSDTENDYQLSISEEQR